MNSKLRQQRRDAQARYKETAKGRATEARHRKVRRARCQAAHLCVDCGKPNDSITNKSLCCACRARQPHVTGKFIFEEIAPNLPVFQELDIINIQEV